MIRLITSFSSEKDIIKASKSKVPVVFLGGDCSDNSWRKEIEKEFGEDLYLLDPFDKKYDKAEDTYKELAGMVNSDYVIFYKGGEQSDQEKKFLDLIGRRGNLIKEFDEIDSLKKFLRGLKNVKLSSIGSRIRKCAEELSKEAMPHITTTTGKVVDFCFDKLDDESIVALINDLFSGKTISLPVNAVTGAERKTFSIDEINPQDITWLKFYIEPNSNPPRTTLDRIKHKVPLHSNNIFFYDTQTHTVVDRRAGPALAKVANKDATYDYSCTMINLPKDLSDAVIKWGKENISDDNLYVEEDKSKGRENEIHITVFYGIKSDNPAETAAVIAKVKPFEVRLGLINAFKDKKEYDVLKIEVESGDLEKLHYDLEKKIDNDNTYPTYKPHVTIGYVKKDVVNKFIGDETFKGKTFKVDSIVFSDGKNVEKKLPLGI